MWDDSSCDGRCRMIGHWTEDVEGFAGFSKCVVPDVVVMWYRKIRWSVVVMWYSVCLSRTVWCCCV